MASLFYGYNLDLKTNTNEAYLYQLDENNSQLFKSSKPGIFGLTYLFTKFLDKDYSRFFAEPKLKFNINHMERGYYPNNLMSDISKANLHYEKLNEMFKLEEVVQESTD